MPRMPGQQSGMQRLSRTQGLLGNSRRSGGPIELTFGKERHLREVLPLALGVEARLRRDLAAGQVPFASM